MLMNGMRFYLFIYFLSLLHEQDVFDVNNESMAAWRRLKWDYSRSNLRLRIKYWKVPATEHRRPVASTQNRRLMAIANACQK